MIRSYNIRISKFLQMLSTIISITNTSQIDQNLGFDQSLYESHGRQLNIRPGGELKEIGGFKWIGYSNTFLDSNHRSEILIFYILTIL